MSDGMSDRGRDGGDGGGPPTRANADRRERDRRRERQRRPAAARDRSQDASHMERSASESVFTTESIDWIVPSTVGLPQRT